MQAAMTSPICIIISMWVPSPRNYAQVEWEAFRRIPNKPKLKLQSEIEINFVTRNIVLQLQSELKCILKIIFLAFSMPGYLPCFSLLYFREERSDNWRIKSSSHPSRLEMGRSCQPSFSDMDRDVRWLDPFFSLPRLSTSLFMHQSNLTLWIHSNLFFFSRSLKPGFWF